MRFDHLFVLASLSAIWCLPAALALNFIYYAPFLSLSNENEDSMCVFLYVCASQDVSWEKTARMASIGSQSCRQPEREADKLLLSSAYPAILVPSHTRIRAAGVCHEKFCQYFVVVVVVVVVVAGSWALGLKM